MTAPLGVDSGSRINLIGCVTGNLGLGIAARAIGKAALARGFNATVFDLDPGDGRGRFEVDPALSLVDKAGDLRLESLSSSCLR